MTDSVGEWPVAVREESIGARISQLRDSYSLIEKLKALPPHRQAEVEDFVDFLRRHRAVRST